MFFKEKNKEDKIQNFKYKNRLLSKMEDGAIFGIVTLCIAVIVIVLAIMVK